MAENDAEMLSRLGTDGEKWAQEFLSHAGGCEVNEDLLDSLRGWFANAIEAGRTAGAANPWLDPRAQEFVDDVMTGMAPKLADSAIVMSLVPDDRTGDVKWWVELGASIAMNKPILAVAFTGELINPKLEAVADEIVYVDPKSDLSENPDLSAALKRMTAKVEAGE